MMKNKLLLIVMVCVLSPINRGLAQTLVLDAKENSTITLKKLSIGGIILKNQPVTILKVDPEGIDLNILDIEPFSPYLVDKNGKSQQIETSLKEFVAGNIHVTDTEDKSIIDLFFYKYNSPVIVESVNGIVVSGKTANSFAGTVTLKGKSLLVIDYADHSYITLIQQGSLVNIYGNQIELLNGSIIQLAIDKNTYIKYNQGEAVDTVIKPVIPPDDRALVYVLRNDNEDELYNVKCDADYVGELSNGSGLYFFLDPGSHYLRSFFGDPYNIEVESGKVYFFNLKGLGGQIMKGEFSDRTESMTGEELSKYGLSILNIFGFIKDL